MVAAIIIGAIIAGMSPYLVYRLTKQDKTLQTIELNVNSRLGRIEVELARMTKVATDSVLSGEPVDPIALVVPIEEEDHH